MKVLVIANGKGGVGKTTTAVNMAALLSEKQKVLLVDADRQGSSTWWVERSPEEIFHLTKETDPKLLKHLRKVKGYEVVIVDTPPALHDEALRAVVEVADYMVLPTSPAPMDLAALIETVRQAIAPVGVKHRVLLNKVDTRSLGEALEAQQALMNAGIPVFNAFVRAYKAHERAALDGVPITKWKGGNAREAEADYRRVVDELSREWGN